MRQGHPTPWTYGRYQPQVAGKTVDLSQDPPPDLVVEIDITHTDIDKLALYARMGVLEFWRYDGRVWRIYELVDDKYQQREVSPTFSWVPKETLYGFLEQAKIDEIGAEKVLREWIRQHV